MSGPGMQRESAGPHLALPDVGGQRGGRLEKQRVPDGRHRATSLAQVDQEEQQVRHQVHPPEQQLGQEHSRRANRFDSHRPRM